MPIAYLFSQALAAVALGFGVYGFLHPRDKHLKLAIGTSALFMALHFAMLGAWVGMVMSCVGALRFFAASRTHNLWVMTGFMLINVGYGAYAYHVPADFLPILGSIVATYAVFNLQGSALRLGLMAGTSCWFAYNAAHLSLIGMTTEAFYLTTNALTLLKTRKTVIQR